MSIINRKYILYINIITKKIDFKELCLLTCKQRLPIRNAPYK